MRYLIALAVLLVASTGHAAPSISSASGGVVYGSGFGTKSRQSPIGFYDFESATSGVNIEVAEPDWTREPGLDATISTSAQRTGSTKSSKIAVDYDSGSSGVFERNVSAWVTSTQKVFGAWIRADFIDANDDDADGAQLKIMSIEATASHASPPGFVEHVFWCWHGSCDSGNMVTSQLGTSPGNRIYLYGGPPLTVRWQPQQAAYYGGEWMYVLLLYTESSYNTANGAGVVYKSSTSGSGSIEKDSTSGVITQMVNGTVAKYAKVRAIAASGFKQANVYYDDIYIDDDFARIEIGDNPVYDSCTHREIQKYTAWADGSVTFTENRGSFTSDTAYLFIVDGSNVASSGYLYTFDTDPPEEPPEDPPEEPTQTGMRSGAVTFGGSILTFTGE